MTHELQSFKVCMSTLYPFECVSTIAIKLNSDDVSQRLRDELRLEPDLANGPDPEGDESGITLERSSRNPKPNYDKDYVYF